MRDKRQNATKVKCKWKKSLTINSQHSWNIVFARGSIWVCLSSLADNTILWKNKTRKICQIYIWNPMTTGFIMLTLICVNQYGISSPESQTFLCAKRPQRQRARRNGCFRRLLTTLSFGRLSLKHFPVSARCLFLADTACQKVGDIHHLVFLACSYEFLRFGFI